MASSSDPEHSIAGISLPQWMKNKINDRYDLDQSTFSPPTEDDSFFYIRYPKTEQPKQLHSHDSQSGGSTYRTLSDVLENHTLPCQDFIPAAKTTPRELGMKRGVVDPPLGVAKSTGTDDGFHGIGAACGQSVVAVAHQMISSGKLLARGRKPQSSLEAEDEAAVPPPSHMLARRRGSKSLPSSPQTSPKLLRKNPFFTNGLLGSSDNITAAQGKQARQSWLLSYVRDTKSLRGSMSDLKISEESHSSQESVTTPATAAVAAAVAAAAPASRPKQKIARPKPSQLREMNFWSPTSM